MHAQEAVAGAGEGILAGNGWSVVNMEDIHLKFVVEGASESVSRACEGTIRQITPDWVRFQTSAASMQASGIDMDAVLSGKKPLVLFIYINPIGPPIQALGAVSSFRKASHSRPALYNLLVEFEEIAEGDYQRLREYQDALLHQRADDRRRKIRRHSDRFLTELQAVLEILVRMSEGQKVEFGERFANLVGAKSSLGRRLNDKGRGDAICSMCERLASNLARLVGAESGLRKVKIRKKNGKDGGLIARDESFLGWEETPPEVGKRYCIYLQGGGLFRSAAVTSVREDHFRTRNSLYEIEHLQ